MEDDPHWEDERLEKARTKTILAALESGMTEEEAEETADSCGRVGIPSIPW